jgi:hypothetical protein
MTAFNLLLIDVLHSTANVNKDSKYYLLSYSNGFRFIELTEKDYYSIEGIYASMVRVCDEVFVAFSTVRGLEVWANPYDYERLNDRTVTNFVKLSHLLRS